MKTTHDPKTAFMQTLQHSEQSRHVDSLIALFAEDAELSSPTTETPLRGHEGARTFWQRYLDSFHRVRSQFTNVIDAGEQVVLEWTSDVVLPSGKHLTYQGVSILELAEGQVKRFRTYFDSAPFSVQARKNEEYQQVS